MYLAVGAESLILHERTAVAPGSGIVSQFLTFHAKMATATTARLLPGRTAALLYFAFHIHIVSCQPSKSF